MTQNKSWKPVGWYCLFCHRIAEKKSLILFYNRKCFCNEKISKWIRMYVKKELL